MRNHENVVSRTFPAHWQESERHVAYTQTIYQCRYETARLYYSLAWLLTSRSICVKYLSDLVACGIALGRLRAGLFPTSVEHACACT